MSAQHTPGPWVADFHNEQRDGGRFITYVRGGNQLVPIAAAPTGVDGYGREEGRANARLIASAPELFEAATFARHYFANIPASSRLSEQQKALNLLADAIAKATGES